MQVLRCRQDLRTLSHTSVGCGRQRAFTLVELLLVMAMLVVATSLVMPGVGRWQRNMPLDQSLQQIKYELARTRVLAMSQGTAWTVTFRLGGRQWSRTPTYSHDTQLSQQFMLPEEVRFESAEKIRSKPEVSVRFLADGTATPARLILRDVDGTGREIRLDRLTGTMHAVIDP